MQWQRQLNSKEDLRWNENQNWNLMIPGNVPKSYNIGGYMFA